MAHVIIKAEKSHDLSSANSKPRRSDGVSSNVRAKDRCLSSTSQAEIKFSFVLCSGLDAAHSHWGGLSALLSPPIQMLILSSNTLPGTPRIMFNQMSGHLVVQSS